MRQLPPLSTRFPYVTSANLRVSPQNFLTLGFKPFAALV